MTNSNKISSFIVLFLASFLFFGAIFSAASDLPAQLEDWVFFETADAVYGVSKREYAEAVAAASGASAPSSKLKTVPAYSLSLPPGESGNSLKVLVKRQGLLRIDQSNRSGRNPRAICLGDKCSGTKAPAEIPADACGFWQCGHLTTGALDAKRPPVEFVSETGAPAVWGRDVLAKVPDGKKISAVAAKVLAGGANVFDGAAGRQEVVGPSGRQAAERIQGVAVVQNVSFHKKTDLETAPPPSPGAPAASVAPLPRTPPQPVKSEQAPDKPVVVPVKSPGVQAAGEQGQPPRRASPGDSRDANGIDSLRDGTKVYLPATWHGLDDSQRDYPIVLFLHGVGESGTDHDKPLKVGLYPQIAKEGAYPQRRHFQAIVVFPQCPVGHSWTDPAMADRAWNALHAALKKYHNSGRKVHLTGVSMGGYGVWELVANHPNSFASLTPISSGLLKPPTAAEYSYIAIKTDKTPADFDGELAQDVGATPTWVVNGAHDKLVSPKEMEQLATLFQGRPSFHYQEPSGGHGIWTLAYADPRWEEWLFSR